MTPSLRHRLFQWAVALKGIGGVFLGLFLLYQVYRVLMGPSPGFVFLTVVDAAIIVLIWREYVATAPDPRAQNDS